LNFASEKEAQNFMQILDEKIRQKQEKKQGRFSMIVSSIDLILSGSDGKSN